MAEEQYIAVVDDDPDIQETFREYLSDRGYIVTAYGGASELREHLASGDPLDLVLLDVTMPGEDGLSLARYLSTKTDVKIIMVTASGDTVDRVIGLELGADDYLAKPVDLRELLARVKAVLRRAEPGMGVDPSHSTGSSREFVGFGNCRLDMAAHQLLDEDGHEIKISAMEYDLLRVFAERPNRVLSRDNLLSLAHHGDWEPFDRSIDIRISRLRRKIERDPGKPEVLKTVRGSGYIFVSK